MNINSALKNASLQIVTTDVGLDDGAARVYFNISTLEMLVGRGTGLGFSKFAAAESEPIGTIKTSILDEAQYQAQIGSNNWLLCDGQVIPPAKLAAYQAATGKVTVVVPDARGLFFRMKNHDRDDALANPAALDLPGPNDLDGPTGNTFTDITGVNGLFMFADGLHNHSSPASTSLAGGGLQSTQGGSTTNNNVSVTTSTTSAHDHDLASNDGETAPKHMIVNYFIKIGI